MTITTLREAEAIAGVLGEPSKMPGYSYGLPAKRCKTGATLVEVKGSVCSGCYALKGNYRFPSMQTGLERRFQSITHPLWVAALIFMIQYRSAKHFRWHDSGDIQSLDHLEKIADVAEQLPKVRFWLPTREKAIVAAFLRKHMAWPSNLIVRLSGTMIDGPAPIGFPHTSTVVTSGSTCPAPRQGNACGPCRRCWNPRVANVAYAKH